ncbi:M48 family metalloprotease [Roseospirillum parvum]|uniref:Peptidase family M48 n=1 Tax=Roseospirillum parvum TaxID=83401 RepID=A0A1G7UIX5_9PROT|nr:M48 family metalloprotease [Roseospirillum parvum]SDG46710.1 Peptidase family M48 [Roseospirillum parvum]
MRRLAFLMVLGLALVGLGGCKTTQALLGKSEPQHAYQEFQEQPLIGQAQEVRIKPLEPNFYTDFLDDVRYTEGGQQVGLNVRAWAQSRAAEQRALALGAVTPLELTKRTARNKNFVPLEGPGARAITDYVQTVINRLLAQWPHQPLDPPVTAIIIDNPSYMAAMNRFNVLQISIGLLVNVETEDELAAVIAHELTHSLLNHHDAIARQLYRSKQTAVGATFLASLLAGDGNNKNAALAVLMLERMQRHHAEEVGFFEWQREHEIQADLMALDLTKRAGYDWGKVAVYLERLQSQEEAAEAAQAKKGEAGESEPSLGTAIKGMINGLDTGLATLINGGEAPEEPAPLPYKTTEGKHEHPSAEERLFNLAGYERTHYRKDVFMDKPSVDRLHKVVWRGAGFEVIKRSVFLNEAEEALEANDHDLAAEKALAVLEGANDPDPRARIILFHARKGQGNIATALKNLEIARAGSGATKRVFTLLLGEYIRLQRWDEAFDVLKHGQNKVAMHPEHEYFALAISLTVKAGDQRRATSLLQACARKGVAYQTYCQSAYMRAMEVTSTASAANY